MRVVLAGESPLVEEVGRLCQEANHQTTLYVVEDFLSAVQSGYVMEDLSEVEVAIELHNESAPAKQELLITIDGAIPADTLLLTSALATSVTQAASWLSHPQRVVGFGVVPPVANSEIVELASGLQTEEQALAQATLFWRGIGREAVVVDDGPGLVRARIVCCLINEAINVLQENVATAAEIDKAMRLGTSSPRGPLEWGDLIGLDTVLGVMTGLYQEWGDDRYRPSPLLRRMVQAGHLGRKSGRGFFPYD